jgi:hypothetical protein
MCWAARGALIYVHGSDASQQAIADNLSELASVIPESASLARC